MSEEMIARYRQLAESGTNFQGLSIIQHAYQIGDLIRDTGAQTLLDFGCGRGDQYKEPYFLHEVWGVPIPTLYDPAFADHDMIPAGKFDGVLCSDVLEHVPYEEVPAFVRRLFDYAEKFVWASVCCRVAKKKFDDGLNMHVTVQAFWWWQAKFVRWSRGKPYVLVETR